MFMYANNRYVQRWLCQLGLTGESPQCSHTNLLIGRVSWMTAKAPMASRPCLIGSQLTMAVTYAPNYI